MMTAKNTIRLTRTSVTKNAVEFSCSTTGSISEAFTDSYLKVEYDTDITKVPISILNVVFAVQVLPVAWFYDAELFIECIDKDFYDSIAEFKKGYIEMCPKINFLGKVTVGDVIKSTYKMSGKSALFFSGGVDATSSLVSLVRKKINPTLVTVWGADIALNNTEGWHNKYNHTIKVSKKMNLDYTYIKSNFRTLLNNAFLTKKVMPIINDGWWHAMHHGIGLIGLIAPYAYVKKIQTSYIASSYTKDEVYVCASDPTIDNYIKFSSCSSVHDGYDLNRQQKIANIVDYLKKKCIQLPVIVCWESKGGKNCGHCEKCLRTAAGLIARGVNPGDFGIENFKSSTMRRFFKWRDIPNPSIPAWSAIKNSLTVDSGISDQNLNISWLKAVDLTKVNDTALKNVLRTCRNVKNYASSKSPVAFKKILKKILRK